MKRPYRFPRETKVKFPLPSHRANIGEKSVELFEGYVQGKSAAKAEERVARALDMYKQELSYQFRQMFGGKELDFLVYMHGRFYPANLVEKSFIHRGRATDQDVLNETILMDSLRRNRYNPQPFQKWDNTLFDTQEDANKFITQTFFG